MQEYYFVFMVNLVSVLHLLLLIVNTVSVAFLIAYMPFYVWVPLISLLASPIMGGHYCFLNRLENLYRGKAGMPFIVDRSLDILK